jgi:hypothetical protein
MKYLIAAALAGALASTNASATTFDFSYTFLTGDKITGSLEGTQVGSSIENVSNVQMAFDGLAFDEPLVTASFNLSNDTLNVGTPVISTDGTKNNFAFANAPSIAATQYFLFVSAASEVTTLSPAGQLTDGPYNPAAWSIQPVPLPAAGWLLCSGIGLLGVGRRRLRAIFAG